MDKPALLNEIATLFAANQTGEISAQDLSVSLSNIVTYNLNLSELSKQHTAGELSFDGGFNAGSFEEIATYSDFTTQTATSTDTVQNLKFGAGGSSAEDIVSAGANGVLTILKAGPLALSFTAQAGRNGQTGNSELFMMLEMSANGGVSWSHLGESMNIRIDDDDSTPSYYGIKFLTGEAGVKLRMSWARSSTGNNSGDFVTTTPSVALQTLGMSSVPSAKVTVYKSTGHNYL